MKSFRDQASQVDELYSKSSGYDAVNKAVDTLEKSLHRKSHLAKGIAKGMGDSFNEDFDELQKLMNEVSYLWEEMKMAVESQ